MEKNIFAQKMKCKAEKEKEGILREDFFGGREENGEGKGGKYLEYSIALCNDNFQPSVK